MTADEFLAGYLGPFCVAFGTGLAVACVVSAARSARLVRYGTSAEGVLRGFEREWTTGDSERHDPGRWLYRPVVEFTTATGVRVEFRSHVADARGTSGGTGRRIPVLYLPDQPHLARIRSFWTLWGLPVILFPWSAITLAFGVWWVGRG